MISPAAVSIMMQTSLCSRRRRARVSPSSPGMLMSRITASAVFFLKPRRHRLAVHCGAHMKTVPRQVLGDHLAQVDLVIDDEDFGGNGHVTAADGAWTP